MKLLDTPHKKKSAVLTTLLGILFLLLFFLLGLTYYDPPISYGMEVNFGTLAQGSGAIQPVKTVQKSVSQEEQLVEKATQKEATPSEVKTPSVEKEVLQEKEVYLWVGGRGNIPKYQAKAKKIGIGNFVRFTGMIKENLPHLYRSANLFVLPSKFDTFGIVVIEALVSGLSVFVSETTGASDLLDPNSNDQIIPFNTVCTELSKCINSAFSKEDDKDIIHQFKKNILMQSRIDFYATFCI